MARLAVDTVGESEEEFPALDVLIGQKALPRRAAYDVGKSENGDEGNLGGKVKKVVKKRVLNSRNENPLLQRLGTGKGESARASETSDSGILKGKGKGKGGSERFEAYLELEREEQFGENNEEKIGAKAKGRSATVSRDDIRRLPAPKFGLKVADEVLKATKVVVKSREPTPVVDLSEEDIEPRSKITRERRAERKISRFVFALDLEEEENSSHSSEEDIKPRPKTSKARTAEKKVPEALSFLDIEAKESGQYSEEELKPRSKPVKWSKADREAPEPGLFSDLEEEYSQYSDEDDDGMSDFIVNDSEDESIIEIPPPKSVRKLVRGRRPVKEEDDLEIQMGKLNVEDEDSDDLFRNPQKDVRKSSRDTSSDIDSRRE